MFASDYIRWIYKIISLFKTAKNRIKKASHQAILPQDRQEPSNNFLKILTIHQTQ